jgi:hypothetical protein
METQDKLSNNQAGTLSIRKFEEQDYPEYCQWYSWLKRANGNKPTYDMLSTDGLLVENKFGRICAGFLYITNSNIAMIEFVFANPTVHRDIRKKALKKPLTSLEAQAINKGYELILILTNNLFYSRTLTEGFGYEKGNSPHYEHVKVLI